MKVTYSDRIIFMTIFLEEETYESLGISLFLFQFFVHSVYRLLEKEADEVLVSCFCANHSECGNVFLTSCGWDDEKRMT